MLKKNLTTKFRRPYLNQNLNLSCWPYVIIFFSFFFFNTLYSGDEVNNGGGIGEQNIIHAYLNLEKYISICVNSHDCQLTENEKNILLNIKNSLIDEYKNTNQIQFRSEEERPGTFILDGEIKIAKTGNLVGSPIYINTDMLYYRNFNKSYEAISIDQAISILIHEMGHHHGIKNHTELDLLGIKVAKGLSNYIQSTSFFSYMDDIKIVVFNEKKTDTFPKILIYIGDEIIDASKELREVLKCNLAAFPTLVDVLPDFAVSFERPTGAIFHNVHWNRSTNLEKIVCQNSSDCKDSGKSYKNFYAKGNLDLICEAGSTLFNSRKHYKALIKIKTIASKDKNNIVRFKYEPNSLKIKQLYEPWWKIIKLNVLSY